MQYVLDVNTHDAIIHAAYKKRGYNDAESATATHFCRLAAWHGIKTHNGIKALKLDDRFGSGNKTRQGSVPGAAIQKLPTRFEACQVWNANFKLGQAVAAQAMDTCIELADRFGVGIVSVDNAFHYLWGGGYVMEAANKGYIAYTNCTSGMAEVVPFGGKHPTLGTNPHSWGFPTKDIIGYPIVIDWASSVIAAGRVEQYEREGKPLPPNAAVDADGNPTTDPTKVAALLPFARHKGYSMALIDELVGALIGGSLPTVRGLPEHTESSDNEKNCVALFFQVIHPDALSGGAFACGRDQSQNVKAVLDDILGHGNENCLLPGQIEAQAAQRSQAAGGLLFTAAEIDRLQKHADEAGVTLNRDALTTC